MSFHLLPLTVLKPGMGLRVMVPDPPCALELSRPERAY